jgi:hypothetical protein
LPARSDASSASRASVLNVLDYDVTAPGEWEAWAEGERARRGFVQPAFELLADLGRHDVVKRWLAGLQQCPLESGIPPNMLFIHYYAISGFVPGVIAEIKFGRHTKDEVGEALAVALLHSFGIGMFAVAPEVREYLRTYQGPSTPIAWPDGWAPDADFLRAGLDFSTLEMLPGELELLESWYVRVTGEVPRHVRFLGELRPSVLKAYRNRFENTLRVLPKQVLPWLQVHYHALARNEEGLRDNLLLAKGFGLTQTQIVDALVWAMLYGNVEVVSLVDRAAGDVIRKW